MEAKPKLVIFASGTATAGGDGFANIVTQARSGFVWADIVCVISNHENGGVRRRAEQLEVPFLYFGKPWTAERYAAIRTHYPYDFCLLYGWRKRAVGLDPKTTVNIHPAPLPQFGGKGMYGMAVHQAVWRIRETQGLRNSAVTMHFVTEEYDAGPIFFSAPISLAGAKNAEAVATRVRALEHSLCPSIVNMVVQRRISWDGEHPESLLVPEGFPGLVSQPA